MSKTTRLIKLFTELAEDFRMELGQNATDIWIYKNSSIIVHATFNEEGSIKFYLYNSSRGYESHTKLAADCDDAIRNLALFAIQG